MHRRTATTLLGVIGFIIISGCGTVAPGPAPTGKPSAAAPGRKEHAAVSAPRRIIDDSRASARTRSQCTRGKAVKPSR